MFEPYILIQTLEDLKGAIFLQVIFTTIGEK